MQRRRLLQYLQSFATKRGLAAPILVEDQDGQHVFVYSNDKNHRYAYSLTWSANADHILWIMLNPGTGETEGRRRNTFERCKQWSKSMGYGGLLFGNVFSLRSKSAQELLRLQIGPDPLNDEALLLLKSFAPKTIVAWGNHGAKSEKPSHLSAILNSAQCFGYTKIGQPRHPLYVRQTTPLVPWPRGDA